VNWIVFLILPAVLSLLKAVGKKGVRDFMAD